MLMDSTYIETNQVIHRYNVNKLTDNELSDFEVYILENPEVITDIEKDNIIALLHKEQHELLRPKGNIEKVTFMRGMAIAACLMVTITILFNSQGANDYSLQAPIVLQTFRGAGDQAIIVSGQPIVQLQIDMGPVQLIESNAFTVEVIATLDGSILFQDNGLVVNEEGWLNIAILDQSQAIQGLYEIKVSPDTSSSQTVSYQLNFIE